MHRNYNISIVRVLAMISIVFGHWCNWKQINLYQFGAIGVEIFLFISGYLYGDKKWESKNNWLLHRYLKLMPPIWIMTCLVFVSYVVLDQPINIIKKVIVSLLGLQGISFVAGDIHLGGFSGLGQTWFVTVILLCYFLLFSLKNFSGGGGK